MPVIIRWLKVAHWPKIRFAASAFAAITGLLAAGFAAGVSPPRPNLVVIFVDDLGWLDVGYQGDRYQTPNIDAWSRSGMVFTQAYTPSPACSPSRAGLLTGQHPAHLRIFRHIPGSNLTGADKLGRGGEEFHTLAEDPAQFPSRNWLPLEPATYASALRAQGYRSAFIGKWHLGDERFHPDKHGFDEQIGTTNLAHPPSYHAPYWEGRSDVYAEVPRGKYLTDQQTDDTVAYLERQKIGQPFLLTLAYYAVHTPHQGRADLVAAAEARGLRGASAHLAAMVAALDESIGRIRATLEKTGLARNTLVIFTSDQGSYFGGAPRFRGGKTGGTALNEGGSRVPFFVVWPGVVSPGTHRGDPITLTDVFPTLVQAGGGDIARFAELDGKSLLPVLRNEASSISRQAIFLYRSYGDQYAAVRTGDWKLLAYRSGQHELFNLKQDEAETTNQSTAEPEKLRELTTLLDTWEKAQNLKR
jgi:arylsulfatase A-like enzyme